MTSWTQRLTTVSAVLLTLFHLYTAFFGLFDSIVQRSIHLSLVMLVGLLMYPAVRRGSVGLVVALAGFASCIYPVLIYGQLIERMGMATPTDVWVGAAALLLVVFLGYRAMGWPLSVMAVIFLLYAMFGKGLPFFFSHRGVPFERLVAWEFITTEGLWGIPLGVMASFVFLFVLYGSLLAATGAGDLIMDLAIGLTGWSRGGPAKVAVISSSLFGTISGSVVANVVSTGTFTIPLMKRVGYPPYFAGAVEAVASTGGSIMPPVMGAAAFVMADVMGVGYSQVAKAAVIPALLYYAALFFQLHLRAVASGIRGLTREELPDWRSTVRRRWHLALSPTLLIYMLIVEGASATKSVFWAIVALLVVSSLKRETRLNFQRLVDACVDGARQTVAVTLGTALAGVIVGVVTITGLGLKFTTGVVDLSGGSLPLLLVLLMVASLILGMGVTATVAYLLPAIVVAPVLINMGVGKMGAHFFAFYFATISYITPPVAIGAYAAAGIAKASPMRTGWMASKLGIVGFIVPFLFVAHPSLLMESSPVEVIYNALTAFIGVFALAAAMEGYLFRRCNVMQRMILAAGGLGLITPGVFTDVIGLAALGVVYAWQYFRQGEPTAAPVLAGVNGAEEP